MHLSLPSRYLLAGQFDAWNRLFQTLINWTLLVRAALNVAG